MDAEGMTEAPETAWAARPLLLAGLGLITGLIAHLIFGNGYATPSSLQVTALTGVILAAGLTGFTLERRRWQDALAFSVTTALVGALIVWWNGPPDGWAQTEGWRMLSLLLAVALAAPLFQAARDEGARRFPYEAVHDHAWTNVVLWFACWAFVGIVIALAWLLAMLFDLIKLDFLRHLLEENWFWRGLIGLAFGGALGLLREQDGVVRLLYRVVATVLAVLAPVLAVGLVLFVLALPFTGLDALWKATSATTPILLCCAVGALILANAVIGNRPEQERRSPPIRFGAMALAAVLLPLAMLAVIATGLRIGQYGFTPERLWALVFVSLACLYGAAYLASLILGRRAWAARVRPYNLVLAFVTCGVALVLATPIVSFNAISTRDQLARLESGRTPADKFDWRALAFDFGKPGRDALKKLQASANPVIKARAAEVGKATTRGEVAEDDRRMENRRAVAANTRVLPRGTKLPEGLRDAIAERYSCVSEQKCTVFLIGDSEALLFMDSCFRMPPAKSPPAAAPGPKVVVPAPPAIYGCRSATRYLGDLSQWREAGPGARGITYEQAHAAADGYAAGQVEIRTVPRRQAYVGGVPVGEPFE